MVYCYKKAKGESIDYRLAQRVRDAGLDVENTNFRRIQKELIPLWKDLKYENMRRCSGSIKKVFDRGRYGFISNDFDSEDTFFRFNDFKDSEDFIYPGTKVSFYLEDSFDKRKGKVSPKAVEIEAIL